MPLLSDAKSGTPIHHDMWYSMIFGIPSQNALIINFLAAPLSQGSELGLTAASPD
jgi:hypothetical protein